MSWKTLLPLLLVGCLQAPAALWAADAPGAVSDTAAQTLPEDDSSALEISQQLASYQASLEAMESEFGPYDVRLNEVLMDTGRYYMSLGQFDSASASFERALSITRINEGLYSESQLAILESLIGTLKAAGEWVQADDREHLALHIQTRLYEPGSQAYAEAVLAFGDWKIQAVRGNLLQRSGLANMRDIEELPLLYQKALGETDTPTSAQATDMRQQTRFDLLYGKAYAQAQLADYALRSVPLGLDRPVQRYISEYVCRDVVNAQGQVSQSCGTVRRENPLYREIEMQRQLYRDRIQIAVSDLQRAIVDMEGMLASDAELQARNNGAAPARVEELKAIYTNINREYRRSAMRW
ncbi:MAG: hypothetical protein H7A05_04080 [Pseudomonadales bacterium]|nr:hypothetical protein [Pseudomonadales bacterium]MCP5329685.1 hypothetical protein [Pseudomonadales bacterium]MCP5343776.1 hypothetical protein [Pseudomonadales bacterium]